MVVKADALKAQLDGEGFIHTDYMLNRFAVMAARDKGNLDEALEYLKQMYVLNVRISDAVGSVSNRNTEPKCLKPSRTDFFIKTNRFSVFTSFFLLLFLKKI